MDAAPCLAEDASVNPYEPPRAASPVRPGLSKGTVVALGIGAGGCLGVVFLLVLLLAIWQFLSPAERRAPSPRAPAAPSSR